MLVQSTVFRSLSFDQVTEEPLEWMHLIGKRAHAAGNTSDAKMLKWILDENKVERFLEM